MQYQFIKDNRSHYPVDEMCECFSLKRSGFYSWLNREPSARSHTDQLLKERILGVHQLAKGRYGHRPIHAHLKEDGHNCGRDRTLRLMQELRIAGCQKKGFKPIGTDSKHNFGYSANLLKQLGKPTAVDQVWVADTTYLRVNNHWCYLATVMDLFTRRIIGWSVSDSNNTALVSSAFKAAVLTRGKKTYKGLIHHSDRGSTYASDDYMRELFKYGIQSSMSSKGNCYDNAAQESFYGRYKTSSVGNRVFVSSDEARSHAFEYIEVFYNRFRKHSSLGYKSPVAFESEILPPPWGVSQQVFRLA
jgi:transposase InsO family protein